MKLTPRHFAPEALEPRLLLAVLLGNDSPAPDAFINLAGDVTDSVPAALASSNGASNSLTSPSGDDAPVGPARPTFDTIEEELAYFAPAFYLTGHENHGTFATNASASTGGAASFGGLVIGVNEMDGGAMNPLNHGRTAATNGAMGNHGQMTAMPAMAPHAARSLYGHEGMRTAAIDHSLTGLGRSAQAEGLVPMDEEALPEATAQTTHMPAMAAGEVAAMPEHLDALRTHSMDDILRDWTSGGAVNPEAVPPAADITLSLPIVRAPVIPVLAPPVALVPTPTILTPVSLAPPPTETPVAITGGMRVESPKAPDFGGAYRTVGAGAIALAAALAAYLLESRSRKLAALVRADTATPKVQPAARRPRPTCRPASAHSQATAK